MNIILIIIELLISLIVISLMYKKLKLEGLNILVIVLSVLQYILSFKEITIYNIPISNGLIFTTIMFIIMNIIIQTKGKEEAMHTMWIMWLTLITSFIILTMSSICTTTYSLSYNELFSHSLRLFSALTIAELFSLIININIYYYLRRLKNKIWISNILSGIISQFIESIIFILLLYIFSHNTLSLILMILISSTIKIAISILSTIYIYIITKSRKR